jgi:hypothetical protein
LRSHAVGWMSAPARLFVFLARELETSGTARDARLRTYSWRLADGLPRRRVQVTTIGER